MNQEQYDKIKEYRDILISAYEAQFVRGVELSQFNIIKMVYEEITKDIYNGLKINCSSCVIKLYSMMGESLINFENHLKRLESIKMIASSKKMADDIILDTLKTVEPIILIKTDEIDNVKILTNNISTDLFHIEDTRINTSSKNKTNKKNIS